MLDCSITFATFQAIGPPGDIHACHQTFQVPFPGANDGLIKIVQIKTTSRRGVPYMPKLFR
jgi:hypothetical protein